ncbi:CARDB domain-containing protein [Halorubrum sp. AD140]|uniref:COG1361 S-layer family protein n=1 Tax=Halorubrum sp. AD140 TaxID=3050073 RepID=UPI002ACC4472|nr:CARDB domain-containing protein [Halorubrum sp. AD140]MDZ5811385.1 CARDB domain-containing protein [Halorubrum sp. AD140]
MSRTRTVVVVALTCCLLAAGTALVAANDTVSGDPDIEAFAPETAFVPGEEATLQVSLNNRGDVREEGFDDLESEVVTAHETTARIPTGDETDREVPFDVRTGEQTVGDVPRGVTGPIEFTVVPDEDAEPGTYRVPIELEYRNVYDAEDDNGATLRDERVETETVYVDVEITDRAQFAVVDVDGPVQAGDTGTVDVTMRNVRNETAREASVAANPIDPDLSFTSEAGTTETFVDDWAPGENRTLTYRLDADPEATARASTLEFDVDYRDAERADASARTVRTGVTPLARQSFDAAALNSSLTVGEDGSFTVEVRNDGPRPVEDAVVAFDNEAPAPEEVDAETVPADPNVVPRETRVTVGDLGVGESTTATFDAGIRTDANPGNRTLNLAVRYRGLDDDVIVSDALDTVVDVRPEEDVFSVRPAGASDGSAGGNGSADGEDASGGGANESTDGENASNLSVTSAGIAPGETARYDVVVRNTGSEPVSNVQAKLFVDDPLSSDDDEAFVTSLDPGEETTVSFEVDVDGGAAAKTYSAAIDFRYDDAAGDEQLSDTHRLPVEVVDDDDGGLLRSPAGIVALFSVLALCAAAVWKRGRVNRALSRLRERLRDRGDG